MSLPSVLWSWAGDGGSLLSLTSSRKFHVGVLNPEQLIALQVPREMKTVPQTWSIAICYINMTGSVCLQWQVWTDRGGGPLDKSSVSMKAFGLMYVVFDRRRELLPGGGKLWGWTGSAWKMPLCLTGQWLLLSRTPTTTASSRAGARAALEISHSSDQWAVFHGSWAGTACSSTAQGAWRDWPLGQGTVHLAWELPTAVALSRGGHPWGAPGQAQEHSMHSRNRLCRQKTSSSSTLALLLLPLAGEGWEAPGALGPTVPAGSAAKRVLRCGGVGVPAYIMLT